MIDLLTPREAAKLLDLSVASLMRLVREGRLAAYRLGPAGGKSRFSPEDLNEYVSKCRKIGAMRRF